MADGGLFSPVMRVLRCVVASRLAQNAMGRQPTTGILLPVQREVNIRRRRSPAVLFCSPEAFGLLNYASQTTVGLFAVCVKPEVVVSRPEVVFRDRKWLSAAQILRLRSRRV